MRAILADEADVALAVAKGDKVFAQQPHPHRRAVGLLQLTGEQRRNPIEPHRLAHRGTLSDPGQKLVFLAWQHF